MKIEDVTFRGSPGRFIAVLVALVLVGALVGLVAGKAYAAPEPAQREAQAAPTRCATMDDGACRVTKKGKRFSRKFRAGDLGHNRGFRPRAVFQRPARARRLIVRRIDRMLDAARAASREAAGGGGLIRARGIYHQMVSGSTESCSMFQSNRQFTGPLIPDNCNDDWGGSLLSPRTVANSLLVTACVGAVGVTLLTPVGRAQRALKFLGLSFEMTSCVSTAWLAGME